MPKDYGTPLLTRVGRDQSFHSKRNKPGGTSWFLGIGIDAYTQFTPLNNAVRDVEAISALLIAEYDLEPEHCVLLKNADATRSGILRALRKIREQVQPHDKLIIYYSGHGHLNTYKEGFWIPVSVAPEEEEDFVSNARLREMIKTIPARHILVISDSCFSGTLFVRGANRAEVADSDLDAIPSRWAICSGRHDEQVADGPRGKHSPFAQSILDELKRNRSDVLRVASLADRVVEVTRANYDQLPEGSPLQGVGHQGGQYVFRRRSSEDGLWERCVVQNTSLAYDNYLEQYPNGKYVMDAEEALAALEEEEVWLRTKTTNTLTAYRSFQRRFPDGKFYENAKKAMQNLRQQAQVSALLAGEDEAAIQRFLKNNPNSTDYEDLDLRLAELAQQRQSKKDAEASAVKKIARKQSTSDQTSGKKQQASPKGKQAKPAQPTASVNPGSGTTADKKANDQPLNYQERREKEAWSKAQREDTAAAYETFISHFPYSLNLAAAKKRINTLHPGYKYRKVAMIGIPVFLLLVLVLWRPWAGSKEAMASGEMEQEQISAVDTIDKSIADTIAPPRVDNNMVLVRGGEFQMGDLFEEGYSLAKPVHKVVLDDFYLGKYEVTFNEYDRFCEATNRKKAKDNGWGRDSLPVIYVSWYDAVDYCNWRSAQEGLQLVYTSSSVGVSTNLNANGYRLPTEEEWEYAARARGQKLRYAGFNDPSEYDKYGNLCDRDCPEYYRDDQFDDGARTTAKVGRYQHNGLGLYDLSGNVREWCSDWYVAYRHKVNGATSGKSKVVRGGSWQGRVGKSENEARERMDPQFSDFRVGFRLARTAK